ncbi:efflux RND transporter periplasmic adaptor subunit [Chloroflexota bacterium]
MNYVDLLYFIIISKLLGGSEMKSLQGALTILLLIMIIGFTACSLPGSSRTDTNEITVVRGDFVKKISGSGNLGTQQEARYSFSTAGKISHVYVRPGESVQPGDSLIALETDALALAQKEAEADLAKVKAGYFEAQDELLLAEIAFDAASHDLENLRVNEDGLRLALLAAQIAVRSANIDLDNAKDTYFWPTLEIAENDLEGAETYLLFAERKRREATTNAEYDRWDAAVANAKENLRIYQNRLDEQLERNEKPEVIVARLQLEAAQLAEEQAERDFDDLSTIISFNERSLEAAKNTVQKGEASVEYASQTVELAEQSLALANKNLEEVVIKADFDGIVSQVEVKEGDIVPASNLVLVLVEPRQLELVVEIDEIDIPQVAIGQEAVINLDAIPEEEVVGEVAAVYPVPTQVTGLVMYNVRIALNLPRDSTLKIGMRATAEIISEKQYGVITIPNQYLQQNTEGKHFIYVVVDGKKEERMVTIGTSNGTKTEITDGLSEGEKITS